MKTDNNSAGMCFNPLVLILLSAVLATGAFAGDKAKPHPPVMPPHANTFGQSLTEWAIAHAKWQFELPASQSPVLDGTGCLNGANGQSGHVWFLAGAGEGEFVRHCTVPKGKALFVVISASFCSFAEGAGTTEEELRACAQGWEDLNAVLILEIDGVPVENLNQYRVVTPLFEINWPEDNLFGFPAGSDPAVADATAVLLPPLSKGNHTIHRRSEASDGYISDVTWHLEVR